MTEYPEQDERADQRKEIRRHADRAKHGGTTAQEEAPGPQRESDAPGAKRDRAVFGHIAKRTHHFTENQHAKAAKKQRDDSE